LAAVMDTAFTAVLAGPNPPPKFKVPVTVLAPLVVKFVSSTQNLIVIRFRFNAVAPVLITSKVSFDWLAAQVVNSSNCRPTPLVPQATPAVGVGVKVAVESAVKVAVQVAVRVAVAVTVEVALLVTVEVAVLVGVAVAVAVAVRVAVWVGLLVALEVAVKVAVAVGLLVGVRLGVKVGLEVAVGVGVEVVVPVTVRLGVEVGVPVALKVGDRVGVAVEVPAGATQARQAWGAKTSTSPKADRGAYRFPFLSMPIPKTVPDPLAKGKVVR
jgi:hypothetical protein